MLVELQFAEGGRWPDPVVVELEALPRKGEAIDFPEEWRDEALAGEAFEVRNVIHVPAWPQEAEERPVPPILVLSR